MNITNFSPISGRTKIIVNATEVNAANVAELFKEAYGKHSQNMLDMTKLWNYAHGDTDIRFKEKTIRSDINHQVSLGIAYDIVNFKIGQSHSDPTQYIQRQGSVAQDITEKITLLNSWKTLDGEHSKDKNNAEYIFSTGLGYKLIESNNEWSKDKKDVSPFCETILSPHNTFMAYSNDYKRTPLFAAVVVLNELNKEEKATIYTKKECFYLTDGELTSVQPHRYGDIPIVEYTINNARMAAFESAISAIDALEFMTSNRVDDVEQTVNAFMYMIGASVDADTLKDFEEQKFISIDDINAKIGVLEMNLNQGDSQVLANDLYAHIRRQVGMPQISGGASTSDTKGAVELRDGYYTAATQRKIYESSYADSEIKILRIKLRILEEFLGWDLSLSDIDIKFTGADYEHNYEKAQILSILAPIEWMHPEVALLLSQGAATDIASMYAKCMEWKDEQDRKQREIQNVQMQRMSENAVSGEVQRDDPEKVSEM